MSDTEKAIDTVENELLKYGYGYGEPGKKKEWENVLARLQSLNHLEKGVKVLFCQ